MSIRTRFAPSPTGFLHVGNIRTGLFAYLVAHHSNGTFILRLEDTDKKREVAGSADHLLKCLEVLGIRQDEGVNVGGPYAPYIQSERLDHYKKWAQKLIDSGRAYADPYTPDELTAFREQAKAEKRAFLYRHHRPENPPFWNGTQPLRFKSEPKSYTWHDEVMGELSTGPEVIDDIIIIKSDGFPTYNFAHIVDDAEMHITHVIRGQEFISSQPNYLNIYEALGIFERPDKGGVRRESSVSADLTPLERQRTAQEADTSTPETIVTYYRPIFATMPHILAATGGKKLGKRDGAKDVLDYIRDGILPEALLNFIASLGWNDGTEQEIFSRDELIATFRLNRVQRSGARFDEQRLIWMNGQWIRKLSIDELYDRTTDVAINFWPASADSASINHKKQILALVQDRLKTLKDLPLLTNYFFEEPTPNWDILTDNKQLKKLERSDIVTLLEDTIYTLDASEWSTDSLQQTLNALLTTTGQKPGILFSLIRLAVSWAPFSPALNDTLATLGKETTLSRLKTALDTLS
jgi:glutamyl-tRNA synthetase